MSKRKQKFLLTIFTLLLVGAPVFALAAGLVPCGGATEKPCTVIDAFTLVARVTNWLIASAGIFAVYEIVSAGFVLVYSLGNEETITQKKTHIQNSVIGLALVMMAYMLVNTVVNVIFTTSFFASNNPKCKLDLTSPLTYLQIDSSKCSNVAPSSIYK